MGNGSAPIEDSAFLVDGTRFTSVGRRGEILGIDLGMVAVGRGADFLVLDANPLDDIANTRRISEVYLRGRQVDRAAMAARWQAACRVASTKQ